MYVDKMNYQMVFLRKYIWKMKVPLKIKIFMWFLHQKVILMKDILAKWNLYVARNVLCVTWEESINHTFFWLAPLLVLFAELFTLASILLHPSVLPICSVIGSVELKSKLKLVYIEAFLVWYGRCRNDTIFNKVETTHLLQIIFMATF
jgi:hypothetical protein